MLCQEAVVAVETVLLVVVLAAHQGAVALDAHEALEVPTFLSVRDEVLDMYWEGAAGAVLGVPLSLLLAPAMTVMCDVSSDRSNSHNADQTLLALESFRSKQKLDVLVQKEPTGPTFEAALVKPLLPEEDALGDGLLTDGARLHEGLLVAVRTDGPPLHTVSPLAQGRPTPPTLGRVSQERRLISVHGFLFKNIQRFISF